ncbi:hypothetical protein MTR67_044990 [Solanum verrucosum]|uniref:GH10 domain-containing protein n=1 Tax=Solanum verrucosum TaxID=315347 RepID=A0AAF0ZW73_SOLVR|nr:hypothetical protein MTR67_044990 [Solanum verrucosum]
MIHVVDENGNSLPNAAVKIDQISTDFPFGTMIASTIVGNLSYQEWFVKRFKATVFENDLKWYKTEPLPGVFNYTIVDQMMQFVRKNKLLVRGHTMFWGNPTMIQDWVENMTVPQLQKAMDGRIKSVMSKYRNEFFHWDIINELLHFNFYEKKLGPNATLDMFKKVHRADPLVTLFLNEYNIVENCDPRINVDMYIEKFKELKKGGVKVAGIGLQSHFSAVNPAFMRAVLDKLATLKLPIWLTEVDVSNMYKQEEQAVYLEQILREAFSHPSVNGIMLWSALGRGGCYQMCLTDDKFQNLPTGDLIDQLLLKEWKTGTKRGKTNELGSYNFRGPSTPRRSWGVGQGHDEDLQVMNHEPAARPVDRLTVRGGQVVGHACTSCLQFGQSKHSLFDYVVVYLRCPSSTGELEEHSLVKIAPPNLSKVHLSYQKSYTTVKGGMKRVEKPRYYHGIPLNLGGFICRVCCGSLKTTINKA